MPADVAYTLKTTILHLDIDENELRVCAHVSAEKERHARMAAEAIATQLAPLNKRFAQLFNCRVSLEISSKFKDRIIAVAADEQQ